jgi:predicted DNA-binding protein (MmcQ/YjbR family)
MLDTAALKAHMLSKQAAIEEYPFGPDSMVPKVGGKMFALLALEADPPRMSLKCDLIDIQLLRDRYAAIQPPPYMSKQHWIMVIVDGTIPDDDVLQLIDNSYALVRKGLSRAVRQQLGL